MKTRFQFLAIFCLALFLFNGIIGCFEKNNSNKSIELKQEVQIGSFSYHLPEKWRIKSKSDDLVESSSRGKMAYIDFHIKDFDEDTLDLYLDQLKAQMEEAFGDFKEIERILFTTEHGIQGKKMKGHCKVDGIKVLCVYYVFPMDDKICFFNCTVADGYKRNHEAVFEAVAKNLTVRSE